MKLPKMSATDFENLLHELSACREARTWAAGKTLHNVLKTCDRGDWLLWLLGKQVDRLGWITRKQLVLIMCAVAETSLKYVPKGEERPQQAINTARAWCDGRATDQEVRDAADAANAAANAAYYAAANASYYAAADAAAYAAAYAAYAADAAYYAAYAAADAAYYAAYYAADAAAYAAAKTTSLKQSAAIVRTMLEEL